VAISHIDRIGVVAINLLPEPTDQDHAELHGRIDERRSIRELLNSAAVGRGGALLVTGPPGAGRSALLGEAVDRATNAGDPGEMAVLSVTGVPGEADLAFSALSALLAPVLDGIDELPPRQAAALRAALALDDGEAGELAVREAVVGVLAHAAARRPVLVVVDDLHHVDRASATTLRHAVRRLERSPVAALLSSQSPLDPATEAAGLPRIALDTLAEDAAGALLSDHGWAPPMPVRLAAMAATGGNPRALIELARTGSPAERIEDLAGRVSVPLAPAQRAAFLQQVVSLPAATHALLVIAAAAGDDAPVGAVLEVAHRLDLPADALAAAERAGVVVLRPGHIRFRHPLLRTAIYQDTPYHERRAVHQELGVAVARHDPEAAVRHRAIAAQGCDEELAKALERIALAHPASATEAAVMHWSARLSSSELQRLRRTTAAALAAWRSGQIDLARELSSRLSSVDDAQTAARIARLRGLLEIAEGDPVTAFTRLERVATNLLKSAPADAAVLLVLAVAAAHDAGELTGGRRAADRVAEMGGPFGRFGELLHLGLDGRLPAQGTAPTQLMAHMPSVLGEHFGMREVLVMALGALGPHQLLTREFGVTACEWQRTAGMFGPLAMNLLWLTDVDINLGHYDDAVRSAEEVLQFTRDAGQQSGAALALAQLARVAAVRGDHTACRTLAGQALARAVPARARAAAANASWALALVALAEGDAHDACDRLVLLAEPGTPFSHELIARHATPDLVDPEQPEAQRDPPVAGVRHGERFLMDEQGVRHGRHRSADDDARALGRDPGQPGSGQRVDGLRGGVQPELAAAVATAGAQAHGRPVERRHGPHGTQRVVGAVGVGRQAVRPDGTAEHLGERPEPEPGRGDDTRGGHRERRHEGRIERAAPCSDHGAALHLPGRPKCPAAVDRTSFITSPFIIGPPSHPSARIDKWWDRTVGDGKTTTAKEVSVMHISA